MPHLCARLAAVRPGSLRPERAGAAAATAARFAGDHLVWVAGTWATRWWDTSHVPARHHAATPAANTASVTAAAPTLLVANTGV